MTHLSGLLLFSRNHLKDSGVKLNGISLHWMEYKETS